MNHGHKQYEEIEDKRTENIYYNIIAESFQNIQKHIFKTISKQTKKQY